MTTVSFDQASKFFGAVAAVSDLTLDIADAEFMVLVGPSGSGKTTALRLLAGLEGLSSGHLRIGPETVDRMSPRDRDIAMVFQDYALYPQMSVASNMEFGLKMRKLPRREIGDRVRQAAEVLGLTEYLKRKPGELSGGQRQRVALGRALVREPKVFLMDEPLSNLDASLRAQMRGEIRRLQKEVGTTTVYVTHDQIEAMTMGDRIGVMKDGRLLQVAAPGTLYNHPVNAFVGGFIGSPAMSFGHFKCERLGSSVSMRQGGVELISRHPGEVPASRDNVLIGVRPERANAILREKFGGHYNVIIRAFGIARGEPHHGKVAAGARQRAANFRLKEDDERDGHVREHRGEQPFHHFQAGPLRATVKKEKQRHGHQHLYGACSAQQL